MPSNPNFFAGPYIDRRSEARELDDWLATARDDPDTLFVLGHGTAHLVRAGDETRIEYLRGGHPLVRGARDEHFVLLGWKDGVRCVLIEAGEPPQPPHPTVRLEELRPLASALPADEAGLLAYARGLSIWRARHRFCGTCGAPTVSTRAGHVMACTNPQCGNQIFPRIDPAIIVLVSDGERALLGRQASWPRGRYSTVAGFVEPGESLEDAVAREVFEETRVPVIESTYASSQPWPFPSSLMIGFHAKASPESIPEATGELEDARWFTREDVASGTPLVPPSTSISYRLIAEWFDAGSAVPLASLGTQATWDPRR